ncbi:hypothetical protein ROLI_025980 [Roseobacter fucihabitans]|uniref:Flp pilus assembly protein, pilin Flp n=1 Tax=Roseobacter fucihabitans TaxID=1537242 RepID=A0ABZ2BU71_9RHOB|nr:hypothetical protein [Roseobacter litoralis]MBC6965661.1 hypothetical protein [Roseobacter litoralis]
MARFLKHFHHSEDGAVTVDWVVLTAAVVGLAIAAYTSIEEGATALTEATEIFLENQTPGDVGAQVE